MADYTLKFFAKNQYRQSNVITEIYTFPDPTTTIPPTTTTTIAPTTTTTTINYSPYRIDYSFTDTAGWNGLTYYVSVVHGSYSIGNTSPNFLGEIVINSVSIAPSPLSGTVDKPYFCGFTCSYGNTVISGPYERSLLDNMPLIMNTGNRISIANSNSPWLSIYPETSWNNLYYTGVSAFAVTVDVTAWIYPFETGGTATLPNLPNPTLTSSPIQPTTGWFAYGYDSYKHLITGDRIISSPSYSASWNVLNVIGASFLGVVRYMSVNNMTPFISYYFGLPKTVTSYRVATTGAPSGESARILKSWNLLASNNSTNGVNGDWTTIDTQTGFAWNMDSTFTISNPSLYSWYKLNVTENNGHNSQCVIPTWRLNY